ncbi:MAG: CHASE3 domain-containing protein [Dehalococcoidia bacterium]|nr:CHASE3 domain-containing protein [Dehalococcoidia bacterium]
MSLPSSRFAWLGRAPRRASRLPLEHRMRAAIVVSTVLLLGVLGITYLSAMRLIEVAEETRRSHDLLADLGRLQAYTYDLETGSRGYVISGDDRQLGPYYSGRGLLQSLREKLRDDLPGDSHLASLFAGLEPVLDARVAFADDLVALRRAQGFESARNLLITNQGQDLTDDIRARLGQMQANAGVQLEENRRAEERSGQWVFYSSAVAALVTVVLFVGAYVAVRSELATRRRSEAALRQSRADVQEARARLAGIIDSAHDAILAVDAAGTVTMFNRGAEKLLGIPAHEAIGLPARRFVPERYLARGNGDIVSQIRDMALDGSTLTEMHVLRADGTEFAAEARASAAGAGSKELHTIIIRDVHERRAAEEALRLSEANYRAVVDGSSDAIFAFEVGPDGVPRLSFANAAAEAVHQTGTGATPGLTIAEIFPREEAGIMEAHVAEAIATGRSIACEQTFDLEGEERAISAHLTPILDAEGHCYRIIANRRDVTELRRARRLDAEARHAQSLAILASGIAHDFNNVLATIMGNAGLAAILAGPNSPASEPVREIESAAGRAGDLVAQLLTYSGQVKPRFEAVDLCRLVESLIGRLRPSLAAGIVVSHECEPGLAPVEADPAQLRQAIGNILLNAAEAIGDSPGVISVNAGIRLADRAYLAGANGAHDAPEGEYVYVDIKDTGPGMDPETIGQVFDPFFTTKFAGRGLGLPAALGIVRSHGGMLRIDSVPGRGTLIALLFPRVVNRQAIAGEAPAGSATGGSHQPSLAHPAAPQRH